MRKVIDNVKTAALVLMSVLFLQFSLAAQDRRPDRDYQAGNTYALSDIETINTKNGNLMMNIPLASLPAGRGGNGGYTLSLHYNSKIWNSRQAIFDNRTPPTGNPQFCDQFPNEGYYYITEHLEESSEGGWYLGGQYDLVVTNRIDHEGEVQAPDTGNISKNYYKWKVRVFYPDGSLHDFVPTIGQGSRFNDGYFNVDINGLQSNGASTQYAPTCSWAASYSQQQLTTGGMNYYSTDGSFTRLFIPYQAGGFPQGGVRPWMLYMQDGTIVEKLPADAPGVSQRITDRNGNKIKFDINGISDDFGRSITGRPTTNETGAQTVEIIQKGVSGEELIT